MKIVIRADTSRDIGTGHLMRCLALAQGWKDAGREAVFLTFCDSERPFERVKDEGFRVHSLQEADDVKESAAFLQKEEPDWVVIDGYHFAPDYQKAIKDSGYRLLVIDDFAHLEHYYADIILNQNYGADRFRYSAEPYTRFLLGTEYVLLRREFLSYMDYEKNIPVAAEKLLITFGGVDPDKNTLRVLEAINLVETCLDVKAIVGAGNPHCGAIKDKIERSRHRVEMLRAVSDMALLMAWADVAVSAGGTTVWELAFMGLPALLCIVADNQERAVEAISREGAFQSAGWVRERTGEELSNKLTDIIYSKDLRNMMHRRSRALVDGRGVQRVCEELLSAKRKRILTN